MYLPPVNHLSPNADPKAGQVRSTRATRKSDNEGTLDRRRRRDRRQNHMPFSFPDRRNKADRRYGLKKRMHESIKPKAEAKGPGGRQAQISDETLGKHIDTRV